jgi:hypothetical protein
LWFQAYFGLTEAERGAVDSYDAWLFAKLKDGPYKCPQTSSQWLDYVPSDGLLAAIQSLPGQHAPYSVKPGVGVVLTHVSLTRSPRRHLCSQTLKHPLLLLELLDYLISSLISVGHNAVLRPVVLVALHVAATCVQPPNKDLVCLWHRISADWYESSNQLASAAASLAAAGPFELDEAEVKYYRQDVAVREAHKKHGDVRVSLHSIGVYDRNVRT